MKGSSQHEAPPPDIFTISVTDMNTDRRPAMPVLCAKRIGGRAHPVAKLQIIKQGTHVVPRWNGMDMLIDDGCGAHVQPL